MVSRGTYLKVTRRNTMFMLCDREVKRRARRRVTRRDNRARGTPRTDFSLCLNYQEIFNTRLPSGCRKSIFGYSSEQNDSRFLCHLKSMSYIKSRYGSIF